MGPHGTLPSLLPEGDPLDFTPLSFSSLFMLPE